MCWKLSTQTFFAGLVLGLGIGIVLGLGWGASPHDAMVAAIVNLIGLPWVTAGIVTFGVAGIYLFIAHLAGFHLSLQIPLGILGICIGVDAGSALLPTIDSNTVIGILFVTALVLKTLSISWLMESQVGGSSLEALFLALSRRLKISAFKTRLAGEVTFLVIAALLQGPVDWGTMVAALVLPATITAFRSWAFVAHGDTTSIVRSEACVSTSRFKGVRNYLR